MPGPTSRLGKPRLPLGAKPARLLLVDDEPAIRLTTGAILEDCYEVETAEDARTALLLLAKGPFDIVCTDLMMPGLNGFELLRRVAEMPNHIARVLMTGYREYVDKVPDDGTPLFLLIKPFDPSHLMKVIARAWSTTQLQRSASDAVRQVREENDRLRRP